MEPMKEEDIRQYFLQNGGSVRNTDIVNYFRAYLSNPAIRDQARVLFKTYVNKLASVKVENGEKFLVLKRQYFQTPTDVNGNPKQSAYGGPPGSGGLASTTMYGSGGNINAHGYNNQQQAYSTPSNVNHLRRQNSQSQLYGSQFSLSSNYDTYGISNSVNTSHYQHHNASGLPSSATAANFYPASHYSQPPAPTAQIKSPPQQLPLQNINTQQQPIYGSASDFPPEYGLPTLPNSNTVTSPRRFVSPQNSYGSSNSGGSSSSRAPPPYRPPPPAGRFTTSPPNSGLPHGISRRSSMTAVGGVVPYQRTHSVPGTGMGGPASYYSTSSTQNINALMEPSVGMYQYHRSASVTGLPIAVNNSVATAPSSSDYSKYFDTLTGAPPPPVPPRSRRSVERSPSAANSYSSSSITSSHNNHHQGELRRLATKKMDTERMNGGDNNSSSSSDSSPSSANSIQPQHLQQRIHGTSSASSGPTMQNQMRLEKEIDNGMMDAEQEKENINNLQVSDGSINHIEHDRTQSSNLENGNSEVEAKISVRERMQKFNNIASECELAGVKVSSSSRNRRDIAAKHESGDFDTASLSSLDPKSKEWMINAMKCQYPVLNKMAQENPALVRRRDMNGYTALHWAAKMGNLECVKLLAGTYKAEVNIKSNGGYTPLHLAAQFGRQDCYDVLIKTYNADANNRDHSGKKPMQYLVRQDASLSMDTFKKLKEKRRHTEQRERDSSFLRIGSLNVKVKSTTRDAFGYFLGKSTSSSSMDRVQKTWGSDPETEERDKDKQMMPPPPPSGLLLRHKPSKRRQKRAIDSDIIKESKSDSDSDSAFGFGQEWMSPVRD
ncbi:uncharacterized protein LOC110847777 isoform X2 [Folsomia candida]|uniref:uncharacterized protein LOC110847777 isoform X2 n=1 Tax=Folsomia candida TaxID=158441 RepID=UPI000B8F6AC3|nr:uncharacterized protein LOC110847777 isoform X2 [Folsomia candida]